VARAPAASFGEKCGRCGISCCAGGDQRCDV